MLRRSAAAGIALLGLLGLAAPVPAHTSRVGALEIVHPWLAPADAGAEARIRLTLTNTGDRPITLGEVRTPVAARASFLRDGEPVAALTLAPGETLGPDQAGVALGGLRAALPEGLGIALTLVLSGGESVEITAAIGQDTMAPETLVSPE